MAPFTIQSNNSAMVTFDHEEVHAVSVDLLKLLELQGVSVGVAASALGMSLGRLSSLTPLSADEEITFVQALFDWLGAYYAEGSVN